MRRHIVTPAFAIAALIGFCGQANAQALCPELTRLRSEVQEAPKQSRIVPASRSARLQELPAFFVPERKMLPASKTDAHGPAGDINR
jgi:hypothetical protein